MLSILIISISKLLGNYNTCLRLLFITTIISISKLLGNYNSSDDVNLFTIIISISKLLGNYNIPAAPLVFLKLYQYLNC